MDLVKYYRNCLRGHYRKQKYLCHVKVCKFLYLFCLLFLDVVAEVSIDTKFENVAVKAGEKAILTCVISQLGGHKVKLHMKLNN